MPNPHLPYAFPLLFPFFPPLAATSVPLAISELAAADSASSISGVYGLSVLAAGRRLGSSLPTAGIAVASIVWKGAGTKWPAASNHSVNGRVMVNVSGLADLDLGWMVIVRLYSGMFLRVEVAIVICVACQDVSVCLSVLTLGERGGSEETHSLPTRRGADVDDALLLLPYPQRQGGVEDGVDGDRRRGVVLCVVEAELVVPREAAGGDD